MSSTINQAGTTAAGRGDGPGGRSARVPARNEPKPGAPSLVAGLRFGDDPEAALIPAARRARVENRPLVVAVARPRRAWTTDAAVHALAAERIAARLRTLQETAHHVCARANWKVTEVVIVVEPFASTRRGRRRAWCRRLAAFARSIDAELHPSGDTAIPPDHCAAPPSAVSPRAVRPAAAP